MNWIETTVGEYCPFVYGKGLPKAKRVNGTVPVYGSNGVVDSHSESHVNQHGVIIGRKGTCGAVTFSDSAFWPIDTTFYVTKDSLDETRFVYYLLSSLGMENMNSDSAVPGLNRENAHSLRIVIPERKEDREGLGAYLALFDEKIELNTKMNETLEKVAQRIFKSWFIDFDPVKANAEGVAFAGLSPDIQSLFPSEFVESEMGLIPKGWEVKQIGDEVTCVGGATPSTSNTDFWEGGELLWTTPKDLSGQESKILFDTARKITDKGLKKISSGLLPVNTVLMSSRAPVGYLALAREEVAINQGYIAMKCENTIGPLYLLNWLERNMNTIKQSAGGTTFSEISKKSFRPIPMLVADRAVANAFEDTVSSFYEKIEANVRQNASLRLIRDRLLPKLLSGSIEIKQENKAA